MTFTALIRVVHRGMRFILHLARGVVISSAYRLRYGKDWYQLLPGQAYTLWWMRHLTCIIGIRINRYGTPLTAKVLFVSNHISFLDIVVVASIVPVRFLSKQSVRYWPIIGYLTEISGSLFIHRSKRRRLRRTLAALNQALADKNPVLIFPEGTTSLGTRVLKFHSGLFQSVIDTSVSLQPVTLHYRCGQRADRTAAYIDQDNFLLNLLRLLARDVTEAHISFTPAVDTHGHTRRGLADYCHARISQNLAYQLHCIADSTANVPAINSGFPGSRETEI